MKDKSTLSKDKYLSFILRHGAVDQGLAIDEQGFVDVTELLATALKQRYLITPEELQSIVDASDKKRYSFNEDKTRIRANQGHSIPTVSLEFSMHTPPDVLYHGTTERNKASIEEKGLLRMKRHHVHMSEYEGIAVSVGVRYGRVLLYKVDAKAMVENGYQFLQSTNGVWLIDHVPPQYLSGVSYTVSHNPIP